MLVKSLSLTSAIALGPSDLRKDMKAFKSGLVFVAKPKQSAGGIDRSKRYKECSLRYLCFIN